MEDGGWWLVAGRRVRRINLRENRRRDRETLRSGPCGQWYRSLLFYNNGLIPEMRYQA